MTSFKKLHETAWVETSYSPALSSRAAHAILLLRHACFVLMRMTSSASPRDIHALPFVVIFFLCLRPLQDHLHGLVVVSLDLEVRYPAVALGCGNLAMSQEVLDGSKISIGIEKLRGHGMAKPMTRGAQPALSRIGFDPLLDASDR